jgi:hypothetical protein
MRIALVNPPWRFDGSIYFGCRKPHLPLELGYAQALLHQDGHETLLIDCNLGQRTAAEACQDIQAFGADMTIVTTAPTYLFWRCAPPELRVPRDFLQTLGRRGGRTVAVGPHGSVTPAATLRHLNAIRNDQDLAQALVASGLHRIRERHIGAHRVDELLAILGTIERDHAERNVQSV